MLLLDSLHVNPTQGPGSPTTSLLRSPTLGSRSPTDSVDNVSLPGYSPREVHNAGRLPRFESSVVEHVYTLPNSKGLDWLTLKVKSYAKSPTSLPNFMEGHLITGFIEMDLSKPEGIQAVTLTLRGSVVATDAVSRPFLESTQIIWDASKGDPGSSELNPSPFSGKLSGKYSWPYSIFPPTESNVGPKQLKTLCLDRPTKVPPSFSERGSYTTVTYELLLTVKRSSRLRADSILSRQIGYTPRSQPDPPSRLRQMAYQENTSLLGPVIDPTGWKVFPATEISGKLFNTRDVTVKYTLAIATPLEHTRGSVIPFILVVEGSDAQAIDLLSTKDAPDVRLIRKLQNATAGERFQEVIEFVAVKEQVDKAVAMASWWPSESPEHGITGTSNTDQVLTRTLNGEMRLPTSLHPSFKFGEIGIQYFVSMFPPKTAGFQCSHKGVLTNSEVKICVEYARGPMPRAYLPPGYESSSASSERNYSAIRAGRSGFV